MKVDFKINGHKIKSWHWQEKSERYWFYNKDNVVVCSISGCPKPLTYEEMVELFADSDKDINNSMNKALDNMEGEIDENANKEVV